MNQILIYYDNKVRKKQRFFFKFLFVICIFILAFLLLSYSMILYQNSKNEAFSKNLYDSFYIKSLYSSNLSTNSEQKVENSSNVSPFSVIGIIEIEKINLVYPILSKTEDEFLKISPCKFYGPNINEVGNFCIAGHNFDNDLFFSRVIELNKGDIIALYDEQGNFTQYSIISITEVNKNNTSCLSQDTNGEKMVTLITCNNRNGKRIIVKAVAVKEK